jgi:hypothetical protein
MPQQIWLLNKKSLLACVYAPHDRAAGISSEALQRGAY